MAPLRKYLNCRNGMPSELMGLGPIAASQKCLGRQLVCDDVDIWELNEAFPLKYSMY